MKYNSNSMKYNNNNYYYYSKLRDDYSIRWLKVRLEKYIESTFQNISEYPRLFLEK